MPKTYTVSDQEQLNITIEAKENIMIILDASVVSCDLMINCLEDSSSKIFVLNHSQQACHLDVHMELKQDAYCQMGLLDLEASDFTWHHMVELQEDGAEYEILSGQLCQPNVEKKTNMQVKHTAAHTSGQMKNFAVLSDASKYEMVANGNIKKGCNDAHSHQATRVLTLGKNHKAKVIPLLLIDENDVKASHALTIGQPDAEQLYYLQSRGLSTKQAVGLLSVGYFLPVIDMIDDETIHDELRSQMESKVGLYGCE